jgi:hypothetical protein
MEAVESVSLHVRRGDYVSNARANAVHGTCSLAYYRQAIALVRERVIAPRFFIFSDDISWARAHLSFDDAPATFVDWNGPEAPQEDLRLMARCRHHVIANSSLSWWGAWLSTTPGQIVVSPRDWFSTNNDRARDVVPERWIRI